NRRRGRQSVALRKSGTNAPALSTYRRTFSLVNPATHATSEGRAVTQGRSVAVVLERWGRGVLQGRSTPRLLRCRRWPWKGSRSGNSAGRGWGALGGDGGWHQPDQGRPRFHADEPERSA